MDFKGLLEETQDKNSQARKEALKSIKEGLQIGTFLQFNLIRRKFTSFCQQRCNFKTCTTFSGKKHRNFERSFGKFFTIM